MEAEPVYPMVKVKWIDSVSTSGWLSTARATERHEEVKAEFCHSVGYLYRRDDQFLTLVLSTFEDTVADLMSIPARCVVSVTPLTESEGAE